MTKKQILFTIITFVSTNSFSFDSSFVNTTHCNMSIPTISPQGDFVFDRGNPARKQFEEAYDNVCKIPKERAASHIGALSFADDKEVTPLQAADFVAYEVCKVYTDLHLNKKRIRGSLRSLFQQVNIDVRVSVEKNMAKLVASCNAPMEGED